MTEKLANSLLKQKSALGSYLDDMLHHATQVNPVPEVEFEAVVSDALLPAELLLESDDAVIQVSIVEETEGEVESGQPSSLTSATFPIQCLMFKIGNTMMAMPLVEMSSVVTWPENITRLPQEPDWILGVLKHRESNICIVDSAEILQIKCNRDRQPAHILLLGDEKWGLSCDRIDEVVNLEYDDVKWNQGGSNWMTLGTIRSTLSSLLNPQGIIESLNSGRFDE